MGFVPHSFVSPPLQKKNTPDDTSLNPGPSPRSRLRVVYQQRNPQEIYHTFCIKQIQSCRDCTASRPRTERAFSHPRQLQLVKMRAFCFGRTSQWLGTRQRQQRTSLPHWGRRSGGITASSASDPLVHDSTHWLKCFHIGTSNRVLDEKKFKSRNFLARLFLIIPQLGQTH